MSSKVRREVLLAIEPSEPSKPGTRQSAAWVARFRQQVADWRLVFSIRVVAQHGDWGIDRRGMDNETLRKEETLNERRTADSGWRMVVKGAVKNPTMREVSEVSEVGGSLPGFRLLGCLLFVVDGWMGVGMIWMGRRKKRKTTLL